MTSRNLQPFAAVVYADPNRGVRSKDITCGDWLPEFCFCSHLRVRLSP